MYVGFTHIHRAIYKPTYTVTYLPTYIYIKTYFPTHTLMASYIPTYTSIIIQRHLHIKIHTPTHTYMKWNTLLNTVPLHIPLHTHKHRYFITCLCWNTYAGSSDLTHLFAHTSTGDQMHSLQILPLQTPTDFPYFEITENMTC